MAKSEYPEPSDIHSSIIVITRYLSDKNMPQKYEDDKIVLTWQNGKSGHGSKDSWVSLKLNQETVSVFEYLSYDKSCERYNKGFWIDYLFELQEIALGVKKLQEKEFEQKRKERELKLFGKIDDAFLFERKEK